MHRHSLVLQSRALILLIACIITQFSMPSSVSAATTVSSRPTTFANTLVELANADRAARGKEALSIDPLLSAAAQRKANDMAARGYFSHNSPTGMSPWQWFTAVGYSYRHAGENLALNFTDPAQLEQVWMSSAAHRANIVKSVYTEVGVGVAEGMYRGKKATFIVQMFATPGGTTVTKKSSVTTS